jgi:Acetyltransferases, including N-acetylases of ribosomal proteins
MAVQGERLLLRPVLSSDLELLQKRKSDAVYEGEFNNFGLVRSNQLEEHFAQDGLLDRNFGNLVVETVSEHQFVGSVSYHAVHYGPGGMSQVYNIGISLDPDQRFKGYGVEAQRLLAHYLFATYPVERIEATTDVQNIPEQRALAKAGFQREGVLRRAQWRNGSWHDMVLFSILRDEQKKD